MDTWDLAVVFSAFLFLPKILYCKKQTQHIIIEKAKVTIDL